jgi:dTDP-4-dehydrorhamnose reductase
VKILVTGSTGLLGRALSRHLSLAHHVVGLSRHPDVCRDSTQVICNLQDAEALRRVIGDVRPDIVVNSQALADVDLCERDPALAHAQNVETTARLVAAVSQAGVGLLHISTNYVFDGRKGAPYEERDRPNPMNVYGATKLAAEQLVLAAPRGLIVRTSTLFGPDKMNFCDHIVAQASAGRPVDAFEDQCMSPTYTEDVALAVRELVERLAGGNGPPEQRIVHVANEGGASRVEFARHVMALVGAAPALVNPVTMASQRRSAPRPPYSVFTTTALVSLIGRRLPRWDDALVRYLRQRRWIG